MLILLLFVCTFLVPHNGGLPTGSLAISTPISCTIPSALGPSHAACKDIDNCRTRGNIVCTSLVMILACVWTAVHRNIPAPPRHGESRRRRFALRMLEMVKIVVATSLVPEWVLAWAVRQFLNARHLAKQLEEARCPAAGHGRRWDGGRKMISLHTVGVLNDANSLAIDLNVRQKALSRSSVSDRSNSCTR
ncbi:hypothetical protein BV25DRAFT_621093 [Artomyces pyxidatus]|uniref:Uncharacterized protein n=1 Tax=Artomyces pyxidatus TaxID=48021 RepID=A0ACB8T326_9AGAM|nr:hypothetical protein BV25DRAFT_621093 [Artomyces pyxidatus]